MKKALFIIAFICPWGIMAQQNLYRTSKPFIIGMANDTVFRATCHQAMITINTKSSILKIEIFKEGITDNHGAVQKAFQGLQDDIRIETQIDASIFAISNHTQADYQYRTKATVVINGIEKEVDCEYQIHGVVKAVNPSNTSLFNDCTLYFTLFLNPLDFEIESDVKLSDPIEIEIYEGIINEM